MEGPQHWNQGAWGIALGVLSLVAAGSGWLWSVTAAHRVRTELTAARLIGALARLEIAGRDIQAASTRAAMFFVIRHWQQSASEVRGLLGDDSEELRVQLSTVAALIRDAERQLQLPNLSLAAATGNLKVGVTPAMDLAGATRTRMEQGS